MTSHAVDLTHAVWHKSTYSGGNGGQCIEVATNLPSMVAIRDSKNPNGPKLLISPAQWQAFVLDLRIGIAD
jgi:hypothetical protein